MPGAVHGGGGGGLRRGYFETENDGQVVRPGLRDGCCGLAAVA